MRARDTILNHYKNGRVDIPWEQTSHICSNQLLQLEVLLDIRELMEKKDV